MYKKTALWLNDRMAAWDIQSQLSRHWFHILLLSVASVTVLAPLLNMLQ